MAEFDPGAGWLDVAERRLRRRYSALIAQQRYEPAGFKAEVDFKDVRLALAAAVSVPRPVGSVVRDSLMDAFAHQEGVMDLAVLGQVAARRAAH